MSDTNEENGEEEIPKEEPPPDDGKNPLERLVFAIVVVVAMYCGLTAEKLWARWHSIPVVVTFDDRVDEISRIPFPAVTICSENRVRRRVIDMEVESPTIRTMLDGAAAFKSSEQQLLIEAASLQCFSKLYPHWPVLRTRSKPNATHFRILEQEIAPKFRTYECSFLGKRYACRNVFRPILTDYGLCYTFNMLNDHELYTHRDSSTFHFPDERVPHSTWGLERGYDTEHVTDEDYPRRNGRDVGHDSGLRVWFITEKEDKDRQELCSSGAADAFRVLLHLPNEFPGMLHGKFVYVTPGSASHVVIQPRVVHTPPELRDLDRYPPHIRGCYFALERNLSMFKSYTLSNCEADCANDIYRDNCECQLFYYPLEKDTNLTYCPILNDREEFCDKPDKLNAFNILKDLAGETGPRRRCDCLPSCHQVEYRYEHTTTRLELTSLFQARPGVEFSELAIFFEEPTLKTEQRNELYSIVDFGLIGILTGCSVLSSAELMYFLLCKLMEHIKEQCCKKIEEKSPTVATVIEESSSAPNGITDTLINTLITPDTINSLINVIAPKK